jgi:hypothetical protein
MPHRKKYRWWSFYAALNAAVYVTACRTQSQSDSGPSLCKHAVPSRDDVSFNIIVYIRTWLAGDVLQKRLVLAC